MKFKIPASTSIGEGLIIHNATGPVLNNGDLIGKNVTLKHHTTIGDNDSVGSHSIIIGPIVVGDNFIIFAGSVEVKDAPSFSVITGNPAKVI